MELGADSGSAKDTQAHPHTQGCVPPCVNRKTMKMESAKRGTNRIDGKALSANPYRTSLKVWARSHCTARFFFLTKLLSQNAMSYPEAPSSAIALFASCGESVHGGHHCFEVEMVGRFLKLTVVNDADGETHSETC